MSKLEQILIGSILGDGSICKYGTYHEAHSAKQKDYLLWKKRIFDKEFKKSTLSHYKNYYKNRSAYQIYIPKQKIFEKYRELCYTNRKKIISNKFIKRIGKLAVCVWYFDDGSYNAQKNGIQISSMNFSFEENQKLRRMLKNKFGLSFHIHCQHSRKTKYYYLACNGKDTDKFLSFIKKNAPYISKSMTYKMGKLDERNLKLIEKKIKNRKDRDHTYYQKNKKKIRKIHHDYRLNNKGYCQEYGKNWRKNNREKLQKYFQEYGKKNRKKIREYIRKWRKENPEKMEIYNKNRREKGRKREAKA